MDTSVHRRAFLAGALLAPLGRTHAADKRPAPVLVGRLLDGRPYSLAQDRGKAMLVFFWSSRCAVCHDKMPELRANYEAWRDKGFQLLAIGIDRDRSELATYDSLVNRTVPASQKFPILWRGDPAHRDTFGVIERTPTSFILDRQGLQVKEIRGRIDPALWDDMAELVLT